MKEALTHYLPLTYKVINEFWNELRIEHIRKLAETGRKTEYWARCYKGRRIFDGIFFKRFDPAVRADSVNLKTLLGGIELEAPIIFGDMSYGALSGTPNIALAEVADIFGILCGTGEGGLIEDIRRMRNITVQWASARFGVDLSVLNSGKAIVIKIGQGAKPGIGGHLPASKVTIPISETRRIPFKKPAISPAPHHDIYSIEDLGQRIEGLKELTGKPVFVKVAATNYIPYIASGIARMGGDGIIIDGHGGGTGASPCVVRDNVGLPIELATAVVDEKLKEEGLRDRISLIAGGGVADPMDAVKLLALGADAVNIGTAPLIALGCLMDRACHTGGCPALITNKVGLEVEKTRCDFLMLRLGNFLKGWTEEMRHIISAIGFKEVKDVVGRKDLLYSLDLDEITRKIMKIKRYKIGYSVPELLTSIGEPNGEGWVRHLRHLSRTGEPLVMSMGSTAPPFFSKPSRTLDHLRLDGAQVTRPSIDPYREMIESKIYLLRGKVKLFLPVYLSATNLFPDSSYLRMLAHVTYSVGSLLRVNAGDLETVHEFKETLLPTGGVGWDGVMVRDLRHICSDEEGPFYIMIGANDEDFEMIKGLKGWPRNIKGVIMDGDLGKRDPYEMLSLVDIMLRGKGVRDEIDLLFESGDIRGAGDIVKLLCLGADVVGLKAYSVYHILGKEAGMYEYENLLLGLKKEIKLLAGAAGITSLYNLVGNRELLRGLALSPSKLEALKVKPGGT